MKKILLLYMLIIPNWPLFAQKWLWARQGTTFSDLSAIAVNDQGKVCMTGQYFDSITFGTHHLFTTPGITGGGSYIVQYDSLGNILWITQPKVFSGYPNEFLYTWSNAIDKNNNIYITGQDAGLATFGKDSVTTGFYGPNYIPFLVKYDNNGNVLWTRQAKNSGTGNDAGYGTAVTTDGAGYIYMGGLFEDTLVFGKDSVKCSIWGNNNMFLVKYDGAGNVLWTSQATLFTSASSAYVNSLSTDQLNNVYVAGYFTGKISLGTFILNGINNYSVYDAFLAKYDPNGNVLWIRQGLLPSSASSGVGYSAITDKDNNVYCTGYFRDTITFSSVILKEQLSKSGSSYYGDVFLIKYDANGNLIWAKQSSNTSVTTYGWSGYSLSSDENDHIYMTAGGYQVGTGKITFGTDTFSYNSLNPDPAIVMELDTAGNVLCFSNEISGGDDLSLVVTEQTGRYVYWGGDFLTTVVLGKDTAVFNNLGEFPFVARWQSCTVPVDTVYIPSSQEPCSQLFIPDAFSPNHDGENDILYVRGNCINTMDFVIYDRWGNKIFESKNISNGWDGTYGGRPMNTGTFVYSLNATLFDGTNIVKHGSVTLVR